MISFFPTAIALSLVSICLEIYCLFRLTQKLVPSFLKFKHKADAMKDIRIAKVMSLLILDLLTIVPSSVPTNILTDFIPFSIGTVIVIGSPLAFDISYFSLRIIYIPQLCIITILRRRLARIVFLRHFHRRVYNL